MPQKRYIVKEGVWMDASLAELIGIEGGEVVIQEVDDGDVARRALSLTPDQARQVREAVPD